ncbi:hypothetical protein INS49_010450 [Diaporthe citri]|uniref:uncharacterized protein n=1 Tax=Diaporthe citri TaxID=83186 RepID=UPI001C7F41D8|nr:uncharacterized protein INS49_010450 [Diaporthe citri]KAG6362220.1 hypothetical protein INS49_010450 [Diaporthe citri]
MRLGFEQLSKVKIGSELWQHQDPTRRALPSSYGGRLNDHHAIVISQPGVSFTWERRAKVNLYKAAPGMGSVWKRGDIPTQPRDVVVAGSRCLKHSGFWLAPSARSWSTKVVREQGIDKLMTTLQKVREADPIDPYGSGGGNKRVFVDFRRRGQSTANQRSMVDAVTAGKILRLIDVYEKNH